MKKRYYSKVAGARYVFKDGTEVTFNYGFAEIENPQHQEELNAILGRNPMIYVADNPVLEKQPAVMQAAKTEAEIASQDSTLNRLPNRISGDAPATIVAGTGLPTQADVNTVDPALREEVMQVQNQGTIINQGNPAGGSLAERRAAAKGN